MNTILIVQLATIICVAFLGFFVLHKNPGSRINIYFCFFATSIAAWNGSLFIAISEIGQPLFWGRLAFCFGALISVSLYLFAVTFTSTEKRLGVWDIIAVTAGIVIAIASATPLIVKEARSVDHLYLTGNFSPLILFHFIYFFGALIFALVLLVLKYKRANGLPKTQLRHALLGLLSFFIPFIATNIVLPNVFSIFQYNNLGPIFTLPMVFFIAYAIIRHKFLDIRVVIQLGLIYAALLAAITSFYLASIFVLGYLFQKTTGVAPLIGALFTTIVGIFGAPRLEKYFRRVTDPIFFKDKYDYSRAMYALSEVVNKNLDLDILVEKTRNALRDIFKAEGVNIFIFSDKPPATSGNEAIVVPIMLGKEKMGIIVLGSKLSGDPYAKEDLTLLETFSYQVAVAIEKAALYKKVMEHSRELEERVRERTAQIRALEENRQQMMIDISHGLQTPLTVVKGELDVLRRHIPDHEKINLLESSIDKVSKSIYDLLSLARLESQQENLRKERVDLGGLLHDILEYVGVITREKRIATTDHIEPDLVVLGQKDKLEELIVGLVSNAVKYTENAPRKEISVALVKTGAFAELSIEDTGVGISAEDLPHIFERFYRMKNTGAETAKGTGLGLAIAKKIVEKHGGVIKVQSTPGVGTKFIVTLPMFAE